MAASSSDYFMKSGTSTATTLSAPGYTVGNISINVASTTNWPTDTGVTFAIDEVDGNGIRISGSYNEFYGVVSGATQLTGLVYAGGDANRDYSAGATTRVYLAVSSYRVNRAVDGLLVSHNQDGTLSDSTLAQIYPVGSIYINASDSTSPATLFGFGTWEAFGEGRVMVGKAASGTFDTAGATMGAETHTLTAGEMAHTHPVSDLFTSSYGAGTGRQYTVGGSVASGTKNTNAMNTPTSTPHNIIQPSIVVYMWKRTA